MTTAQYKNEYDRLIQANRLNSLNSPELQVHHVTPVSIGGRDDAENLVALTPKDHVRAHDLLFRYYMGCAKAMAQALAGTLGGKYQGIASADDLPDSYDADISEAYKVSRKRTACSVLDMSEKKIGYFDAVPEGYVVRPPREAGQHFVRIFRPEAGLHGKWTAGHTPPPGWKTRQDLTPEELDLVREYMGWKAAAARCRRAVAKWAEEHMCVYSPTTLENRVCRIDSVPDGWVAGVVQPVESMLKARIGGERSCLEQCRDADARDAILKRLAKFQAMLDGKAYDEALRDPSVSGLYEMDGRRMFLRNWAEEYGIALRKLRKRMAAGWDLRRALTEKV